MIPSKRSIRHACETSLCTPFVLGAINQNLFGEYSCIKLLEGSISAFKEMERKFEISTLFSHFERPFSKKRKGIYAKHGNFVGGSHAPAFGETFLTVGLGCKVVGWSNQGGPAWVIWIIIPMPNLIEPPTRMGLINPSRLYRPTHLLIQLFWLSEPFKTRFI